MTEIKRGRDVRLYLVDVEGDPMGPANVIHDIHNANSQTPLSARAEVQCDMGHWHVVGEFVLSQWGGR